MIAWERGSGAPDGHIRCRLIDAVGRTAGQLANPVVVLPQLLVLVLQLLGVELLRGRRGHRAPHLQSSKPSALPVP